MANDNLNQNPGNLQADQSKFFERIANLDIAFTKTKIKIERVQRELRRFEKDAKAKPLANITEQITKTDDNENLNYAFQYEELLALHNLLNSSSNLLVLTEGITRRIINHIGVEEAKDILTLQNDLMCIYNNSNYHLPSIKQFEQWLRQQMDAFTSEKK